MGDDEIKERFEATADLIQKIASAGEERHNREMAKLGAMIIQVHAQLRRAVRLSVEEARRERVRRREADERLDGSMRELAAAQLETERKLQAFLEGLRSGNGR